MSKRKTKKQVTGNPALTTLAHIRMMLAEIKRENLTEYELGQIERLMRTTKTVFENLINGEPSK